MQELTLEDVAKLFGAHARNWHIAPLFGEGGPNQKFRVTLTRPGNDQGVIAVELWRGKCGNQQDWEDEIYGWCLYMAARTFSGRFEESVRQLGLAGLLTPIFVGQGGARVFLVTPIQGAHAATREDILAAGQVAAKRIAWFTDQAHG
jgi:hypothetical protein